MKISKTERNAGLRFRFAKSMTDETRVFIDMQGNSYTSLGTQAQADRMIDYLQEVQEMIHKHREKLRE